MVVALWVSIWALLAGIGAPVADECSPFPSEHERFGFNVVRNYGQSIDDYAVEQLNAGWYVDYSVQQSPSAPNGMQYVQTLLPSQFYPIQPTILGPLIDANPGALWVLGNEPDRDLQDGMTAQAYAVFYHDMQQYIVQRDPTALVAVAGLVQPTPIRIRYLETILDTYEQRYGASMPVDVWTMHNFILNEELDNWGAGIPVGLEAYAEEGAATNISGPWTPGPVPAADRRLSPLDGGQRLSGQAAHHYRIRHPAARFLRLYRYGGRQLHGEQLCLYVGGNRSRNRLPQR